MLDDSWQLKSSFRYTTNVPEGLASPVATGIGH
jgi:hypothetical protein